MVASAGVGPVLESARLAQRSWAATDFGTRVRIFRRLRDLMARDARLFLALFDSGLHREDSESLTAELIPLAEACRFLELQATTLLAPQKQSSRGRPFWLRRVELEITREPHGVVLIIGPANYPLFLPGVQTLQALMAGNAVLLKPGLGGLRLMHALADVAIDAGVPAGLFTALDESIHTAQEAVVSGVDKVIITGSITSGRAVLKSAADGVIPVTAELSGADPVIVLASANIPKTVRAISFGMRLNHGETCIAPRRFFAHASAADALEAQLGFPVTRFHTAQEAVRLANQSDYALGATVFGAEKEAREVARALTSGVVVVNDMIVPTADPRVPFGGRKWSGFGKTRGAEGLLEMTVSKAIVIQRAKRVRHLEPLPSGSADLFLSVLAATHRRGLGNRLKGWLNVCKLATGTRKHQ